MRIVWPPPAGTSISLDLTIGRARGRVLRPSPHRNPREMPISTPSMSHGTATVEVDVLVVGAGAAGMTAALVSSLEGLDVLLCEKSDRVGGTSATSAGTIWVPGTRQSRKAGFTDNVAEAKRYLEAVIGAAPDNRRDTYLETGPQVIDYLDQRSEVKFTAYIRHPDYLANRPGATIGGRALAARSEERRVGKGCRSRWDACPVDK